MGIWEAPYGGSDDRLFPIFTAHVNSGGTSFIDSWGKWGKGDKINLKIRGKMGLWILFCCCCCWGGGYLSNKLISFYLPVSRLHFADNYLVFCLHTAEDAFL